MPAVLLEPPPVSTPITNHPVSALVAAGKVIVVANTKGGVGKSTIATHLVCAMQRRGASVCLVDSDKQTSSSLWLTDMRSNIPFRCLSTSDEIVNQMGDIIADGTVAIADGPAGDSEAVRTLMLMADFIIMPCGPSELDLRAFEHTIKVFRGALKVPRKKPPIGLIVPNKVNANHLLSRDLGAAIIEYQLPVLPSLGQRQAYPESRTAGKTVWDLKGPGARQAAAEMDALVNALLIIISQA